MNIISQILTYVGVLCTKIIAALGYPGIMILMSFESMILPVPSELVMPFAGYLAAKGDMSFMLVILFSSIGSILGSLASYYMGYYGGNKFVFKFGKYLLLDETDLIKTEKWFQKSGEKTVFISRFVPIVRHFISIPAGIGKMDMKKFLIYTLIGATLWNTFLAYLGYLAGENWETVQKYMDHFSVPVAIILFAIGVWFIYTHIKKKRKYNKQNKK